MPEYESNRLNVLYFVAYLVVLDWGLLNLVSGIIYATFKVEQESISSLETEIKQSNLLEVSYAYIRR